MEVLFYLIGCKFRENYRSFLSDKRITGVEKDFQDNLWISTDDDGLYFSTNLVFLHYTFDEYQKNNYVTSMYSDNNSLLLATYDGKIHKGIQNASTTISFEDLDIKKKFENRIRYLFETKNGEIYIAENKLYSYKNNKLTNIQFNGADVYCHALTGLANGSIAVAYTGKINIFKPSNENNFREISLNKRVRVLFEDREKHLWIGTTNGLYELRNQTTYYINDSILNISWISDIKQSTDYLFIATRNNGIFISRGDQNFTALTNKNNFLSKNISALYVENDTCIWINAENSFSRIIIDPKNDSIKSLNNFNYEDGLPSINITAITGLNDLLLLGTAKGLATTKPREVPLVSKLTKPKIIRITINENDVDLYKDLKLKSWQNLLEIEFSAIEYRNPYNVSYYYKLEGAGEDWIPTEERILRFPNLSHGEYKLQIKAIDFHGNESFLEEPIPTIVIQKGFFETNIFYFLIIVLVLSLILYAFFSTYSSLKRKEVLKRQMFVSERKSLLSQMNPHFIFNALNSIQHFFVQRNDKLAHAYLSHLSSLIRRILEFSRINHILLSEELETIRLYLDLEKLRFEEKFNYSIIVDENINPNKIKIPPMIFQPCLENSIIHGLLPKKSMGNLSLTITQDVDNGIKCVIEDNGIGIKKSMEITKRSSKRESMGLANIKERIRLINLIDKTSIQFRIEDLYTKHKASGTRVIINIP